MRWTLLLLVVFLVLWGFAWRSQTKLAFGIFIGLFVGAAIATALGSYESLANIPVWLPLLPFATITVILFVYGILAWRSPHVKGPVSRHEEPDA